MLGVFFIKLAFCYDAEFIASCQSNASLCERHNYYNQFTIPPDYNRHHAPREVIDLEVGLYWNQLLYLDTKQEAFAINFHLHIRWTDKRLTWSAERLEVTAVESKLIWLPRLRSWFAKDNDFAFEGKAREVKLFNNGTIYWIVASETKSTCTINTKYFPFDKHRCIVAFSPEHATNYIIGPLFKRAVISPYSQPNADWRLAGHGMASYPPPPYRHVVANTTYFVDEQTRSYIGPQTGIVWEFEFHRNPTMMTNSWLMPFLVMMLSSNFVFLVTSSGNKRNTYF